jgi:PAS domain S-box-containing protein
LFERSTASKYDEAAKRSEGWVQKLEPIGITPPRRFGATPNVPKSILQALALVRAPVVEGLRMSARPLRADCDAPHSNGDGGDAGSRVRRAHNWEIEATGTGDGPNSLIAEMRAQLAAFDRVLSHCTAGLCVFDAEGRRTFYNRSYAEFYGLADSAQLTRECPTSTILRRSAADTGPQLPAANGNLDAAIVKSTDGRAVRVSQRRLREGGWVETHEDISDFDGKGRSPIANHLSVQALIDAVPDKLWMKDRKSRFVVANKATAIEYGYATAEALIDKTDFDLYPTEQAQKFFEIESSILKSGQAAIDADECVFDVAGNRRWLSTSKVPLRNRKNEIVGLIGISRDITERSLGDVFRDGQAKMLEMIAENLPLEQAIAELVLLIESHLAEVVGSLFIADDKGAAIGLVRRGVPPKA